MSPGLSTSWLRAEQHAASKTAQEKEILFIAWRHESSFTARQQEDLRCAWPRHAQRFGLRRQVGLFAARTVKNVVPFSDAAFLLDAYSVTGVTRHPKAPSPLRSAGAVQKLSPG
jgi:hypothetical protein